MSNKSTGWLAFFALLSTMIVVSFFVDINETTGSGFRVATWIALAILTLTALVVAVTGSTTLFPPPDNEEDPPPERPLTKEELQEEQRLAILNREFEEL